MSKDEFLKRFIALLAGDQRASTQLIENDVDIEFVNGIQQWIEAQSLASSEGRFKTGKVIASLSYLVADIIASGDYKESTGLCKMVEYYSEYIHQTAHAIYEAERIAAQKNKSDGRK